MSLVMGLVGLSLGGEASTFLECLPRTHEVRFVSGAHESGEQWRPPACYATTGCILPTITRKLSSSLTCIVA